MTVYSSWLLIVAIVIAVAAIMALIEHRARCRLADRGVEPYVRDPRYSRWAQRQQQRPPGMPPPPPDLVRAAMQHHPSARLQLVGDNERPLRIPRPACEDLGTKIATNRRLARQPLDGVTAFRLREYLLDSGPR